MSLVTLAVFVIILIAAFYLLRYIPDATLQNVVKIVVIVGAILWLVTNLNALMHLRVQ
jgi:type III secretory pathway component EscS